jgi:IS605 OrfB family transposase
MDSTRETQTHNPEFESKVCELLPDLAQLLKKPGAPKSDDFAVNLGIDLSQLQPRLASHRTMSCYWDSSQNSFVCSPTSGDRTQLNSAVESKLSEMLPDLGQVLDKNGVSEPFTVNLGRKTYNSISRLHARIACIRKDFLHKLTTSTAKTFKLIKIEDLNVSGMLANHKLAGAIADLGFYEFRRQLEYKCQMYGASLVLVDRWFPSSKICSNCGHKQEMPLSIRTYDCPACGVSIDRDLNASLNILNWEPSAARGIACLPWDGRPPNSAGSKRRTVIKDSFS